jgi:phage terminase small subunit
VANEKLTPQQELFCQEYVKDLNGTQAAIRAGYAAQPASARVQASRLLTKANLSERIKALFDERKHRIQVDGDTVLRELLKLATSDLRKLFDDAGTLLPPDKWPDDTAIAVSSVEVEELFEGYGPDRHQIGYTKKIKFWDKPKSLELLGKHLKLFTEKIEHSGKVTLEDLVAGESTEE